MAKTFLICTILLSLVACTMVLEAHDTETSTPENLPIISDIGDGGFFSKAPCGPPCFFEITPGVTTKAEVFDWVQNLRDRYCESFDFTAEGGGEGVDCRDIGIGFDGEIVDVVSFLPSTTITLQEVIDSYGSPDLISVLSVSLPDVQPRVGMILLFDQIQAMLELEEQDGEIYTVGPDTEIHSIAYFEEIFYEQARSVPSRIQWSGYGIYVPYTP